MQTFGGATPLMYACQQCRENNVLDILAKQPYAVQDVDRTLKTPLHYCAENVSTSCAEAVLKIAPELVNAQDENGYSTLHMAVIAGNKQLIKLLIAKGADINIYDNEGHSAVHWAIVSSEKEALEMIIRAGANPSTPDIHGGYPLHYAVQMCGSNSEFVKNLGDAIKVVETLLNFDVDVNVKDKDGRQPILWAASAGSADAIIHLISGGACVEAADKDGLTVVSEVELSDVWLTIWTRRNNPALHCAASRGHTTTLETLMTLCGANVDVIDGNGCSALFYAVTLGHADATELLLSYGAEPNRQDRKGRTPAHCGAAKGQLVTLRILQKHGGNLWLRNVKGDIPLHEAVASGRKDLVLWLLSQNPESINVANNDGRCPIHIASMYNNTEMVKVLLDSKSLVNPVMRTSKGILMTPLNVALSKGHRSCGKYLQLHGGVPFSRVSKVETTNTVYAVRVSPSDDVKNKSREATIESVTPTNTKTSAEDQILKIENGEKKKIYRRRKKKKNNANVDKSDSESDSDDNYRDLKLRTVETKRSGRSNEGDETEEIDLSKLYPSRKTTENIREEKFRLGENSSSQKRSPLSRKKEIAEEKITTEKFVTTKTDSKPLLRNKSFSETKNVSDLSPEDFPPMMESIKQLDTEMIEPEIEVNKLLNEGEFDMNSMPKNTEIPAINDSESRSIKSREEVEIKDPTAEVKTKDTSYTETHVKREDVHKTEHENGNLEKGETLKKLSEVSLSKNWNGSEKREDKTIKSAKSKKSDDEKKIEKLSEKPPGFKSSSDGGSYKREEKQTKTGTKNWSTSSTERTDKSRKSSSKSPKSETSIRSEERSSKTPGKNNSDCNVVKENGEKFKGVSGTQLESHENVHDEISNSAPKEIWGEEKANMFLTEVLKNEVTEASNIPNETVRSGDQNEGFLDEAPLNNDNPENLPTEGLEQDNTPLTDGMSQEQKETEISTDEQFSLEENLKTSLPVNPVSTDKNSPYSSDQTYHATEINNKQEAISEASVDSSVFPVETEATAAIDSSKAEETTKHQNVDELQENISQQEKAKAGIVHVFDKSEKEGYILESGAYPTESESARLAVSETEIQEDEENLKEKKNEASSPHKGFIKKKKDLLKESEFEDLRESISIDSGESQGTDAFNVPPPKEEYLLQMSDETNSLQLVDDSDIKIVDSSASDVITLGGKKTIGFEESLLQNSETEQVTNAPQIVANKESALNCEKENINEAHQNREQRYQVAEVEKKPSGSENSKHLENDENESVSAQDRGIEKKSSNNEEDSAQNSASGLSLDFPKETNEWMAGGERHNKIPRVSRLCRRHQDLKEVSQISVTQLVQNTIRKYHMERGIFYQLLELKRMQIRAGKANEQVLVKRLADDYERSRAFVGMKPFSGLYKFKEFEKFLYDQLKALNSRHSFVKPEIKSYDDIDALSGILKKSRCRIISEIPQSERVCTCITQRCRHSACAYTSVPCSAYIANIHRHKTHKTKKENFFPRIDQTPTIKSEKQKLDEQIPTLELIQGNEKRVITLPQHFPDRTKRYYVTFTIKGLPSFKEEGFFEETKDFFKHRHAKSV